MPISSRILAAATGLCALTAVTGALAQSASGEASVAEARVAWAKRHVELVCRPLETQGMFDKATRCYNDVARLISDTAKPAPAAAAAPRPVAPADARPAEIRPTKPAVRAASRPAPAPVARRIAARPIVAVAQNDLRAPAVLQPVSRRCTGVGCLQYTLLGVGF
ncbi:MAG: hypothetical protein JWR08_51 [Enterovirga sp.]|jgi:hypothetical protein|nr:hypothetical protein [Enterovirga sp.]